MGTPIPKASMKADNAQCVRRKVITVYFTALNYRNMFLEDLEPKLFQEKYVSSVSPLLETTQIVFILFQETTMTGCASRVILTSYSAKIVRNIKHRKIGLGNLYNLWKEFDNNTAIINSIQIEADGQATENTDTQEALDDEQKAYVRAVQIT